MPLLERYISRRVVAVFLPTLAALLGTFCLLNMLRDLDVVTASGQTIRVFVLMNALAVPALAQAVAPIAFLVGVLVALGALSRDGELAAISAAGAPRRAVSRPVIGLAAGLGLALVISHHVVAPGSLGVLRDLVTRVRADLIATLAREGGFRSVEDGLTIHIREKAADGSFRGIFVSDDRSPEEPLQYIAGHGALVERADGAFLVLRAGEVVRSEPASGSSTVLAFDSLAFDLGPFTRTAAGGYYKPRERSTLYLLRPEPDDPYIAEFPARARAELHDRFTAPLYPLAFALIALAFAGRARPDDRDRRSALVAAALACLGLRAAGFTALAAASASPAAIPFLYLMPLAGLLGAALALRRDARPTIPRLSTMLPTRVAALRGAARFPRLRAAGASKQSC